jgi:hypothetical protein
MGESIPPESKSDPRSGRRDPHEAGTLPPPAPDDGKPGADPFRAAIDASARAGSGLSEVSRTVNELSRGLSAATQANERLLSELRALRELLDATHERELMLTNRHARLERERELVTAQQDEFLAALLEEHEDARERAAKIERERDELRAEASQLRARLGTHRISTNPPPPPTASRPPAFRSNPTLELDPRELDATLPARAWTPLPPVVPRFAPPPSSLESLASPRASVFPRESTRPGVGGPKPSEPPAPPSFGPSPSGLPPPPPASAVPTERPPRPVSAASLPADSVGSMPILKRKPDPTTRPLVDYSLGEGGVRSETLEGARIPTKSSKPPKK